ncbi:hypothetical protein UPYG_G00106260 [Umbra pygmaea]|uniref:Uncharacterized protein n=1 Tax=Umbra pygmaea TaxID=75934 RepID=A0ABD0X668_UMBPY
MNQIRERMLRSNFLGDLLVQYISDTLSHIETVREFCGTHSKWVLHRERELEIVTDIKNRADRINLKLDYVRNSKNKLKAFWEFMKTQMTAESKREELEKELGAVLKGALGGMEKLDSFLFAVECLAVTCMSVFEDNQFVTLPCWTSPAEVQAVINAARICYPLLIHFKRNAEAFFMPSLFNVKVLAYQLDRYIQISKEIFKMMENGDNGTPSGDEQLESPGGNVITNSSDAATSTARCSKLLPVVHLGDVCEESLLNMLQQLNQLSDIRRDQHLRMTFLFQDTAQRFIGRFSRQQARMEQFLTVVEESVVKLDRMKMGAKISSVAGSSVGLVGGILSIVGIALSPVTVGLSLALTMTGVGLGVTSGVNSLTTTVVEMKVNSIYEKKAVEIFQRFMNDVESLQECLEDVARNRDPILEKSRNALLGAGMVMAKAGVIVKGIDSIVDCASAVKVLGKQDIYLSAGKTALQDVQAARNLPKLAGDIPDIGQLAKGTPLALSRSARAGFITLNALFIGLDVFFICKDSVNLAKGSKSEMSQLLRARLALWRTEMDSWQRIYNSLCRGIWKFKKCQIILEQRFYPLGGN